MENARNGAQTGGVGVVFRSYLQHIVEVRLSIRALKARFYSVFMHFFDAFCVRSHGVRGRCRDGDGGWVWARIGVGGSFLDYALWGVIYLVTGLEVDREGERRQGQRQGWQLWSPPSQNRDGGHPHLLIFRLGPLASFCTGNINRRICSIDCRIVYSARRIGSIVCRGWIFWDLVEAWTGRTNTTTGLVFVVSHP